MPLYFKELEKLIINWYKFHNIKKPTDSAASWITYKSMLTSAKKDLLKNVIELFNKIEKNEITVIPDSEKNYYIKVEPIQSKL
jgi:hypothetical protein|tara:strand:+ start:399 stop:647 length:249 start_codon:yes stop_codon:yes gene_type:complete